MEIFLVQLNRHKVFMNSIWEGVFPLHLSRPTRLIERPTLGLYLKDHQL